MALQSHDACVAGPAKLVYTYDDVTPFLIHTWQVVDLGGTAGVLTVTIGPLPVVGTVVENLTVNSGSGPVHDISAFGLHMTSTLQKGQVSLSPPFGVSCSWSSA